jgi:hypothetical protein
MKKPEDKVPNDGIQAWTVKVEHLDATDPDRGVGELCIRLPDKLLEQLGWEIGDELEWEDTEICEDWGGHKGFTLSNLTKNPKTPSHGRITLFTWKYGLILVLKDETDSEDDEYELVELFQNEEGNWSSFCKAHIHSMKELEHAHEDVQRDGPNKWFYENGVFTPDEDNFWHWDAKEDVGKV